MQETNVCQQKFS